MPEITNASFYMIPTGDGDGAGSAVDVTQPADDDTLNVTEAGGIEHTLSVAAVTSDNSESFYFIDDGSMVSQIADVIEPTLSIAAATSVADTETREGAERNEQDTELKDNSSETDVKAAEDAEMSEPPPVPLSSSLSDPDSLLTSIRLVIGAAHLLFVS